MTLAVPSSTAISVDKNARTGPPPPRGSGRSCWIGRSCRAALEYQSDQQAHKRKDDSVAEDADQPLTRIADRRTKQADEAADTAGTQATPRETARRPGSAPLGHRLDAKHGIRTSDPLECLDRRVRRQRKVRPRVECPAEVGLDHRCACAWRKLDQAHLKTPG